MLLAVYCPDPDCSEEGGPIRARLLSPDRSEVFGPMRSLHAQGGPECRRYTQRLTRQSLAPEPGYFAKITGSDQHIPICKGGRQQCLGTWTLLKLKRLQPWQQTPICRERPPLRAQRPRAMGFGLSSRRQMFWHLLSRPSGAAHPFKSQDMHAY